LIGTETVFPEIFYRPKSRNKFIVLLSKTGEKRLISSRLSEYSVAVADLEGDGHKELANIALEKRQGFVLILINKEGQRHLIPFKPPMWVAGKLWVTKMGRKDWLWVAGTENLWLLRHDGKGFQVRHWKFEGVPLAVWQDKHGIWLALYLVQYPDQWIVKILNRLRSLGIPISI